MQPQSLANGLPVSINLMAGKGCDLVRRVDEAEARIADLSIRENKGLNNSNSSEAWVSRASCC